MTKKSSEPLPQGDEAIARIVAEAIASTSEGNGNAVSEAASRIAALVRLKQREK